nr:T-complex protein 1 subunit beta [Tanacetum cinerariifolium]
MAADCARSALLERFKDNKEDAEKFRSDLMKIAMTTLSSKILPQDKEHFSTLAVDAVMRLKVSSCCALNTFRLIILQLLIVV